MTAALESHARLVRLWNRNWDSLGHVFTDIPQPRDNAIELRLPVDDPVVSEAFTHQHLNLSIGSIDPIAWTVTRWVRRGWLWIVTAENFDHHLRSLIKPDWMYLDELRFRLTPEDQQ